jgi:hypothetical protein
MATVNLIGIHLLPSTGEFAYDIYPAVGWQRGSSGLNNATILNFWSNLSGNQPNDYTNAIEQFVAGFARHRLAVQHRGCVYL